MTFSQATSGMRGGAVERFVSRLDTPAGLVGMFSIALAVRLLLAPHVGYYSDLKLFQAWAQRLDDVGTHAFYAGASSDYPPGYLYVLWLIGKISAPPGFVLLKLPAILGDLALAWIAGTFASRITPSLNERLPVRPLVAAAVLFNPAVIMDSTVWGQVDVVPAVFVLWSLLLLFTGPRTARREIASFLLFAVAFAIKPQSGFVLPVMLYALYRRHLHGSFRSKLPREILSIAMPGALALGLWFVLALPFGLGPVKLIHFYRNVASEYPATSAYAFNLWGAVGFRLPDSYGVRVLEFIPVSRGPVALAGISAFYLGIILFAAGVGLVLWRAHRFLTGDAAADGRVLAVSAAAVSLLGFAFLTRMHERYMFYALAFLAPLVFVRPLRRTFIALSALFALDLWWSYAYNNSRGDLGHSCGLPFPGCVGFDRILGGFALDAWQKRVYSVAVVAIALAIAWFGVDWVIRKAGSASARGNAPASGQDGFPAPVTSRLTAVAEKSGRRLHS
jgi:Gpi18-like mannosyltransferase